METKASRRPQWRCWRHGSVPRQGVRGRERHSDREGFDACGEEDRAERPAHEGNGAGTGGSWRVAAPHPQWQQLYGLDAAHSELTTMAVTTATGREHEDCDGGGDCEDVTMEGGSHRSLLVAVMPHV